MLQTGGHWFLNAPFKSKTKFHLSSMCYKSMQFERRGSNCATEKDAHWTTTKNFGWTTRIQYASTLFAKGIC